MRSLAALAFVLLASACAGSPRAPAFVLAPAHNAWIVGVEGRPIGQASFTEAPAGVLIRLEFSDHALSPGWHGLHIHQIGSCADFAAGFQASGAHAGHGEGVEHGLLNPAGPEAGDLPNIFAPSSGAFGAEIFAPGLTLQATAISERQPLMDADGAALIIHAAPDDQRSQPIGGAGARVACAALTPLP